jgi:hypothetical protein
MTGEVPDGWRTCAAIGRWRRHLLQIVRCSPEEIANKIDALLKFCADEKTAPDSIVEQCFHDTSQRKSYLGKAAACGMSLVLQSFLIHNGINTFGELVCMPATPETLVREQGPQWD